MRPRARRGLSPATSAARRASTGRSTTGGTRQRSGESRTPPHRHRTGPSCGGGSPPAERPRPGGSPFRACLHLACLSGIQPRGPTAVFSGVLKSALISIGDRLELQIVHLHAAHEPTHHSRVTPSQARLQFGPVTLVPDERVLLKDGQPVALTPKAFDLLVFLATNPGRLLTKDEYCGRLAGRGGGGVEPRLSRLRHPQGARGRLGS